MRSASAERGCRRGGAKAMRRTSAMTTALRETAAAATEVTRHAIGVPSRAGAGETAALLGLGFWLGGLYIA